MPLSQRRQISIEPCGDLREISAGAWEDVPFSEIEEKYTADFNVWRTDIGNARCTDDVFTPKIIRATDHLAGLHTKLPTNV